MLQQWSEWNSLARPNDGPISGLVVGHNADGRQELFAGTRQGIWHIWQTTPNGGWSDWQQLGDVPISTDYDSLAVGTNEDGRLEIFTLSTRPPEGEELRNIWQLAPNGAWSNWSSLGAPMNHAFFRHQHTKRRIVVGRNQDGRLEVFALHYWNQERRAGQVWQIWQTAPNNGWSQWRDAGRPHRLSSNKHPTLLTVGQNLDGRLELFMMSDDAAQESGPWHIWQISPNNGWSEWRNAGADVDFSCSDVAVTQNLDGRLEVFTLDVANGYQVQHVWQTSPNNGWSEWESLGAPPAEFRALHHLSVAQSQAGCLEIFVLTESLKSGNEGDVWNKSRSNRAWGNWRNLGHPADHFGSIIRATHPNVAIGSNANGKVELFATARAQSDRTTQNDEVWHICQE